MTPPPPKKKNIHKIFIPLKIFSFLKIPKNIEIQKFEPTYVWTYQSTPSPHPWGEMGRQTKDEESPSFSNLKFQTSLFVSHLS